MLKYALQKNQLLTHHGKYLGQPYPGKTFDKPAFIKRLLGKGSLMTETDAVAALNAIENTVVEIIEEGGTINMPLFNTSFSITGVFESPDDKFEGARHKVNINLSKGIIIREAEKRIPVEKIKKLTPHPRILEVKDIFSGKKNETLTSNGAVIIRGSGIKLTGDNPSVGLWFIGKNGEIKARIISENKPSTLIVLAPPLKKGEYQLKLVTQYSSSKKLKTPKVYIYPVIFSVM